MTTITTADLRRSFPRRMRRNAIAALVAMALYTPTAFIVRQIDNNDPGRIAVPTTNPVRNAESTAHVQPDTTVPVATTEADRAPAVALDACGGEFGWVCAFEPELGQS